MERPLIYNHMEILGNFVLNNAPQVGLILTLLFFAYRYYANHIAPLNFTDQELMDKYITLETIRRKRHARG